MLWELVGLEGDDSLGWGGGGMWSRPPCKSLSSNSSTLQRSTALYDRLGENTGCNPSNLHGRTQAAAWQLFVSPLTLPHPVQMAVPAGPQSSPVFRWLCPPTHICSSSPSSMLPPQ